MGWAPDRYHGATSRNRTRYPYVSSSHAAVFVDEAFEEVDPVDDTAGRRCGCDPGRRRYRHCEVDAAVRPARVVVLDVPGEHLVQVRWFQISVQSRHSARTVRIQRSA
jgi:hypothetical protein